MSSLDVVSLSKTLGTGDRAAVLREVSLRVPSGRCVGIKGATGSGKTTLLRIVAGLERPDAGEVRIDGLVVSSVKVHVPPNMRRIGFDFQNLGLWPHLSVNGHLEYVLAASPFRGDERLRRKVELLTAFRLRGLERRRPGELSGGEKHLLALARALAGDVRLLLLDEPFAGLDGSLKEIVVQAVGRLQAERGLTTILVSHDAGELNALCQSVVHLREGRVAGPATKTSPSHGQNGKGLRDEL